MAKNDRIVRYLLLHGADKDLKDLKGKTPLDIAIDNQNRSLIQILKDPGLFSECGYRPPLRPAKKSYKSLIIFLVLYTGINVVTIWYLSDSVSTEIKFVYLGSILITFVVFLNVSLRDPGYIHK